MNMYTSVSSHHTHEADVVKCLNAVLLRKNGEGRKSDDARVVCKAQVHELGRETDAREREKLEEEEGTGQYCVISLQNYFGNFQFNPVVPAEGWVKGQLREES